MIPNEILLLIVQVPGILALAPLAVGITKRVKARCQRRIGPPILQGYWDISKWLRKGRVVSEHASPLFRAVPYLVLGATAAALVLLPGPLNFWGPGDLFAIVGLMGLARFLLALEGLEAGSAFGGMSSSRETALAALVEPALVLSLVAPALASGKTHTGAISLAWFPSLSATNAPLHLGAWILLALAALLVVAIAETGRVPVDNPDTHLELTMIHEGMLLESSGGELAALHLAAAAKQVLLLTLIAEFFLPSWGYFFSGPLRPGFLLAAGSVWLAKVLALSALLGLIESVSVKIRLFRVPEILGAAFLLGLVGAFLGGLS